MCIVLPQPVHAARCVSCRSSHEFSRDDGGATSGGALLAFYLGYGSGQWKEVGGRTYVDAHRAAGRRTCRFAQTVAVARLDAHPGVEIIPVESRAAWRELHLAAPEDLQLRHAACPRNCGWWKCERVGRPRGGASPSGRDSAL